jgi:hypothetical protein
MPSPSGWASGATEQGDEADEAWSTSELRSLSPVFCGQRGGRADGATELRLTLLAALP